MLLNKLHKLIYLSLIVISSVEAINYSNFFELKQHDQIYPTTIAQLASIVEQAGLNHQQIVPVGANKSQGGQTLPQQANGLRVNLSKLNNLIDLNVPAKLVTVQAGMTWCELQKIICPHKLSVKAMQSYADFAIGAALSVNVHGQDLFNNPLIKSVQSFKLINCDGQILNVSRHENSALFGLVIGGYGLFGIIAEVTLSLTDNILLQRRVDFVKTSNFVDYFNQNIKNNPDIEFYSARFDLNAANFLEQVIVVSYHKVTSQMSEQEIDLTNIGSDSFGAKIINQVARNGLLATSDFDFLKNWRFNLERLYFKSGAKITRNRFMSFPLSSLPQDSDGHMYVLQEYFIPYAQVNQFIDYLKEITPRLGVNLLNISARHVCADHESFLSYAPVDACAFVLYIKVAKKAKKYRKIADYAKLLIDRTISLHGRYYLPYQLLGTKKQLLAAYPQFNDFLAYKKQYDYKNIFINQLYAKYA